MQAETESSMKSQVTGVRKSSETDEPCHAQHKRIKLVHSAHEDDRDQEQVLFATSSLRSYSHFSNEINGSSSDLNTEETVQVNYQDNGIFQTSFTNGSINNIDRSMTSEYLNNGIDSKQDTIIDVNDNYPSEVQSMGSDSNITDVKESEIGLVNQEMQSDIHHEVLSDMHHEMPSGMLHEMPSDMYQEMPSDMHQEMPSDLHQEIPSDMNQEIPSDVNQEIPSDVNQEMSSEVYREIQSNIHQEMQSSMHQEVLRDANTCITKLRENYMSVNDKLENISNSSWVSKTKENNERKDLKDSFDDSIILPQMDLPILIQNNLPNAPETFLMRSPSRNFNESPQKNSVTIQPLTLSTSQEVLLSITQENFSNVSGEVLSSTPLNESRKEASESQWCNFVEQGNYSSEGNLEPIANDVASFTPSSHPDETEFEQSMTKEREAIKKEDIKYLGIYDLKTTQLNGHADVILCVAADGNIVLSSSGDTTVKIWNVEEEREICNLAGHSDAVTALIFLSGEHAKALVSKLAFPLDSTFAITASLDCHVKLWSVSDGKEILSIYTFNSITCMDYLSSEFSVVIGTDGGKLEIWDLIASKKIESVFAHESSISSLKINDCYVYSTSTDGAVKVWLFDDSEELQPLYSRRRRETSSTGTDLGPTHWKTVTFWNDILFLGDTTPYLKALNWRIGRLNLFANQLERSGICDAVFVQDNILLSTFYNATRDIAGINVWSLPDITYVGTLTGDVQDIYCLTMTQSEDRLRIVSGGHQLIVWDFNLKEPTKKSSSETLYLCEIDGLGSEVNETNVRLPISTSRKSIISVSPSKTKSTEKKQSTCNII